VMLDTVGFIRDLPPALMPAFSATLEEIADADLLLHVVDATDPDRDQQIESSKSTVPRFLVFNKCDALAPHERETMERQRRTNRLEITRSFFVSALQRPTTRELVGSIEQFFWASGRIEDDPAWQYEVVDEPEGAADLPEVTDLDSERRRRGHTA
jgi:GTPase